VTLLKTNAAISIRNCEIGNLQSQSKQQDPCPALCKGAPLCGNNPGKDGTFMDADARRRALAAAINRIAAGDKAALRLVYAETSAKLFGVCLRILGERSEAEDVLQEVYLTVWRKAASFDESVASPITWLVAIARNRAIDRLRASGASRAALPIEAAADVADESMSAVERLEIDEDRARLRECLRELEQRQAAAIRAAFLDGFTYDELAAKASVPLGTMKSWIRRGLMKLRACLER
jgi:RNA polymerase sigma-70 factor (ECF subfamily)